MKKILLTIITIIPLLFMTCPGPEKNEPIELEVYETYCTEIELKITMQDSGKGNEYTIKRNDATIISGWMYDNEEIVTDDNLEPNTQYSYQAYSKNDESETLTVTTMDTTSHDFTWTIDTLGNYGSILRDVAIIDEDDIWVVGEIRTDTTKYNAAHWDGEKWELTNFETEFLGNMVSAELYSIKYFSENNIWVSSHCFPIHWNGSEWTLYHLQNMGLDACAGNSIWGTSSSNMYFVGDNGGIVHYDGSNFEKIESGTEVDLLDIDGTDDGKYIIITGYEWSGELSGQSVALELRNGNCNTIFTSSSGYGDIENGDYGRMRSVEIFGKKVYITTGATDILFYNYDQKLTGYLPENSISNDKYLKYISGNNSVDIAFTTFTYEIVHYNGNTYKIDNYLRNYFSDYRFRYWCLDFKNDIICVAGEGSVEEHGLIGIGKR